MSQDARELKEVSAGGEGEVQYIKPAELDALEGTFQGVVESNYGPNYKFELEDGSIAIVNGCGALNKKMLKVAAGTFVRLENGGKKPIESGPMKGKSFHDIKVFTA